MTDRWHLLKNLSDTVEEVLARHRGLLSRTVLPAENGQRQAASRSTRDQTHSPTSYAERERLRHRAERLKRYKQVIALRERGLTLSKIADRVGISERTVNRFLAAGAFPERKRRRPSEPGLHDEHIAFLRQRWAEGCTNATQLCRELRDQGFTDSKRLVLRYISRLRNGEPAVTSFARHDSKLTSRPTIRRYSPRQAAMLFVRSHDELEKAELLDIVHMTSVSDELGMVYELAQRFVQMIRLRVPEALEPWLDMAKTTSLTEFRQFAAGLHKDMKTVAAALQYPRSNGQAEGQINRLKLLKRQMYGRANFDLLRQRVLAA